MSPADRDLDTALRWVEDVTGETVVSTTAQVRWRPQYFLHTRGREGAGHDLLLRGYRNPGYLGDESVSRMFLAREAAVLRALRDTDVKVPYFHGYEPEDGWILMDRIAGDELLTDEPPERRHRLFRRYLDEVALLHELDPDDLELPDDFARPGSDEEVLLGSYRTASFFYQQAEPDRPEPLLALGRHWVQSHVPESPHGYCLCAGDIGPNQFLYDGDEVRSLFDLELAHLGDPYEDLGLMRLREMCYPIGTLPTHLRAYAQRRGESLDVERLQYWTMVGMMTGPLWMWGPTYRPDPHLPDQIAVYSFVPIYRRGIAESLMEIHGIEPDPPDRPEPVTTPRTPLHELLVGQLRDVYLPESPTPEQEFRLRGTAALAETLALGDVLGAELDRGDLDDVGALLGRRPSTLDEGLAELETAVREDPEADLARRLRTLHRIEVRRELVYAPVQAAMGFASNSPLARLDEDR